MERKMRRSSPSSCCCFFFLLLFCLSVLLSSDHQLAAAAAFGILACNETDGRRCDRMVVEEEFDLEFQLDSEINRRILAGQADHNSYKSLNPDKPVCQSSNGKAYNCAGNSGNSGSGRPCGHDLYRC